MIKKNRFHYLSSIVIFLSIIVLTLVIESIMQAEGFSLRYLAKAIIYSPHSGQKQGSLDSFPSPIPTSTPTPTVPFIPPTHTPIPPPTNTPVPGQPTHTPSPTASQLPPQNRTRQQDPPAWSKQYCVDEDPGSVAIESCDDSTRCDIAHGAGGPSQNCGTAIGWEHIIIEALLGKRSSNYFNSLADILPQSLQSNCKAVAPVKPYISTFNVIDSYNLAGFGDFSRGPHADATALATAWGSTAGYTVASSAQGLTPGDVVFFSNPPHVGIVNTVEADQRGDGDIWFLHTGGSYYLGKLMIAGWNVVASSTGDNNVRFGSTQPKGTDMTTGETVCYCGSNNICYQHKF